MNINDRLKWKQHEPAKMRMAVFRVIDRTQDDPAMQVQAMSIALVATCRALRIDIKRLLETTERQMDDINGPFVYTFDGIEAYAKGEIERRL